MEMRKNVNLSEFSNYKIGGPAGFFFEPKNEEEIKEAAAFAKQKNLDIFVLGGGTNLLIPDAGFAGVVIKPNIDFLKKDGDKISAGAGVSIAELLNYSIENSLSGLEWAGGLPGALGGAIRGNAGCFGGEIKDAVELVRSFNMETEKIVERTAKECEFGYRVSVFKKSGVREIVLSATLRLKSGDKKEIAETIEEKIAYRRKNHPLEYPNIGSIFKNVPVTLIYEIGDKRYEDALKSGVLEYRGSQFSVKKDPFPVISSAKLISESGLRGVSSGGAMISGKHPNFIVNVREAKSSDVKSLVALAKAEVYKKFGVKLEEEVQIL